jgi:tRNA U38,U39,U40 pseudouridine synthase TruA
MSRPADKIEFRLTEGNIRLIGKGRTDRGTRYTTQVIDVDIQGMDKAQRLAAVIAAITRLLPVVAVVTPNPPG